MTVAAAAAEATQTSPKRNSNTTRGELKHGQPTPDKTGSSSSEQANNTQKARTGKQAKAKATDRQTDRQKETEIENFN